MASGVAPPDTYDEKIWPILVELTAIVNESCHARSGVDSNDMDFAENVQKHEAETQKGKQELSETRRQLKETTEVLRTKDKQLKDSFEAFVFHTKQAQGDIARLKTNCERLQKEKELTEQQKEDIFAQLSCDMKQVEQQRNAYAERARDLKRLWWDSKMKTNELEHQLTDIQFTLGQTAERYRRRVRSLMEDLRDKEHCRNKQVQLERTMHGSVLVSKEKKLRTLSEKNMELEKNLREERGQNLKLQNELTVLKHQLHLSERQREFAEKGQTLSDEVLQDSRERIKELDDQLEKATVHVKEVSDRTLHLERDRQVLQLDMQNAIEQLDQSKALVDVSSAEKKELQEEIASYQQDIEALELQLSSVEKQAERQVKDLELRVLSDQDELKKLQVWLEKSEMHTSNAESQRELAEKDLQDCKKQVKELEDQLSVAARYVKEVSDEASKTKGERTFWQEDAESSKREIKALKFQIEHAENRVEEMEHRLQSSYSEQVMVGQELAELQKQPAISPEPAQFKIYVKIMKDSTCSQRISFSNRVQRSDTIAKMKEEIFKDTGIPVEQQVLRFGSNCLRDDKTFDECNIPSCTTLGLSTQGEYEPIYATV